MSTARNVHNKNRFAPTVARKLVRRYQMAGASKIRVGGGFQARNHVLSMPLLVARPAKKPLLTILGYITHCFTRFVW